MPNIKIHQDWATWLEITSLGYNFYCIPKVLAMHRIHEKGISSNKMKTLKYKWEVLRNSGNKSKLGALVYLYVIFMNGVLKNNCIHPSEMEKTKLNAELIK